MPNLTAVLKSEISRISRHEIRASIRPLHSSTITLKKTVADLKKRLAQLEAENKRLKSLSMVQSSVPKVSEDELSKLRISPKNLKGLRQKLDISQAELGKLLGVSNQTILNWEHKDGKLKMNSEVLGKITEIRKVGKREIRRRLGEISVSNNNKGL